MLLYVSDPHLPCTALGGINLAVHGGSLAHGRTHGRSLDGNSYHYQW